MHEESMDSSSSDSDTEIKDRLEMKGKGIRVLETSETKSNSGNENYIQIRANASCEPPSPNATRTHFTQSSRDRTSTKAIHRELIETALTLPSVHMKGETGEIAPNISSAASSLHKGLLSTSSASRGYHQRQDFPQKDAMSNFRSCHNVEDSTRPALENENWTGKLRGITGQTKHYVAFGYSRVATTFTKTVSSFRNKISGGGQHQRATSGNQVSCAKKLVLTDVGCVSPQEEAGVPSRHQQRCGQKVILVVDLRSGRLGNIIRMIGKWRNKNDNNKLENDRENDQDENVNRSHQDSNVDSPKAKDAEPESDSDEEDNDEADDDSAAERRIAYEKVKSMTGIEWLDGLLVVWHTAFLIISLFLLSVGVILRFYFSTIVESEVRGSTNFIVYSHFVNMQKMPPVLKFGNLTDVLGDALIIINAIYILCVIVYMTYLLHRIPFTLPIVVIVCGALVLTEVNILNVYMSPVSAANERAKKELKAIAESEYSIGSTKTFAITYDVISVWGQCCGVVDQYDFQNVVLKYALPTKSEYKTLQVPPTCCKPRYFHDGVDEVVECASKATADGIFQEGCYVRIYKWLKNYCNLFSIVIVLQLIDICIHILLYKRHLSLLELTI